MRVHVALLGLLTTLLVPELAASQELGSGEPGARRLLAADEEIALARSAAPGYVSDAAEVWVLTQGGYRVAETGTNGVSCMVSRDWLESIEPICYDPEGAATIMRIAIRRLEILHAGRSIEEADAVVSRALVSGDLTLPRRPAVAYMLSASQRLMTDTGQPAGSWRPHLMIYYPFLSASDFGLPGEGHPNSIVVASDGSAVSSMIIVLPEFVEPVLPGDPLD